MGSAAALQQASGAHRNKTIGLVESSAPQRVTSKFSLRSRALEALLPLKTTIISNVYNRAAMIGPAIESVAQQTGAEIEQLVIKGASSDATLTKAKAKRYPGLVVYIDPEKAIYNALNKGISRASVDVVGLLLSDDYFALDDVLNLVMDQFSKADAEAVHGELHHSATEDNPKIIRHPKARAYDPAKQRHGWLPPQPTLFLYGARCSGCTGPTIRPAGSWPTARPVCAGSGKHASRWPIFQECP